MINFKSEAMRELSSLLFEQTVTWCSAVCGAIYSVGYLCNEHSVVYHMCLRRVYDVVYACFDVFMTLCMRVFDVFLTLFMYV